MSASDLLAGLRDIHPPDPVSWWPPAPGWWVLAGLAAGAVLAIMRLSRRPRRVRRAALAELEYLERTRAATDPEGFAAGLSALLRRVALARFPAREVAGLTGALWLEFLDRSAGGTAFREGPGRALAEAPYRPGATADPSELALAARTWIKTVTRDS